MNHSYAAILRNFIPVFFLFGIFSGCKIIDPAEDIPSYIHIDSISLSTVGIQGTNSARITEAWIFVDGELIGGFELPCTVPVLKEGSHHVIIRAGIWMNGQPSTRAIYPFYKGWEGDLTLTKAQITRINPDVTYFSGLDFSNTWMCDFESVGTNFIADPIYLSQIDTTADPALAFEGSSGVIRLNADTIQFVGRSTSSYTLNPTDEIYLEFNYRCDTPFTVGIVRNSSFYPWVTVGASATWNKMYIRLTDVLAIAPTGVNYQIYFGMFKPSDITAPFLYLDNIKLLKY